MIDKRYKLTLVILTAVLAIAGLCFYFPALTVRDQVVMKDGGDNYLTPDKDGEPGSGRMAQSQSSVDEVDPAEVDQSVPEFVFKEGAGNVKPRDAHDTLPATKNKYWYSDVPDDAEGQRELLASLERKYRAAVQEMESVRGSIVQEDPELSKCKSDLDAAQEQIDRLLNQSPKIVEARSAQQELKERISRLYEDIAEMTARLRDSGDLDYDLLLLSDSPSKGVDQADRAVPEGPMRDLMVKKIKYRELRRELSVNRSIMANAAENLLPGNEDLDLLRERISELSSQMEDVLKSHGEYRLAKASVRRLNNKRLYLHRVIEGDGRYVNK